MLIHLISPQSPRIVWMVAQSIFACLAFYFFYSGIVMVLVYFWVPIQLGAFAASAALVAPLNPIKFPARKHRWGPVDIVRRICVKSTSAGTAGILHSFFLNFIFVHLIIFCRHVSDWIIICTFIADHNCGPHIGQAIKRACPFLVLPVYIMIQLGSGQTPF